MARSSDRYAAFHRRWLAAAVVALMLAAGVTANLVDRDPAAAQPATVILGPAATHDRPHPLCGLRRQLPPPLWQVLATVLDVTCPPAPTTTTTR